MTDRKDTPLHPDTLILIYHLSRLKKGQSRSYGKMARGGETERDALSPSDRPRTVEVKHSGLSWHWVRSGLCMWGQSWQGESWRGCEISGCHLQWQNSTGISDEISSQLQAQPHLSLCWQYILRVSFIIQMYRSSEGFYGLFGIPSMA